MLWKVLTNDNNTTDNNTNDNNTTNFQNFTFFQGVFHVLERYVGFEPWDLFPLTIKCYGKCLQNYKGTIFSVAWTEKYQRAQSSQLLAW